MEFAEPWWKRLFFLRSFQQMTWMTIIVMVLLFITTTIHMPRTEALVVLSCWICGTLPSFILALPGKFTVEGDEQAALRIVYRRLTRMKFTPVEKDNGDLEFFYHGPKSLRWGTTHVSVHKVANKMTVTGSYEVLRTLRRALIREEQASLN